MNSDTFVGFGFGIFLGLIVGIVVFDINNQVWENDAVGRGYGEFVPKEHNQRINVFQWKTKNEKQETQQ